MARRNSDDMDFDDLDYEDGFGGLRGRLSLDEPDDEYDYDEDEDYEEFDEEDEFEDDDTISAYAELLASTPDLARGIALAKRDAAADGEDDDLQELLDDTPPVEAVVPDRREAALQAFMAADASAGRIPVWTPLDAGPIGLYVVATKEELEKAVRQAIPGVSGTVNVVKIAGPGRPTDKPITITL